MKAGWRENYFYHLYSEGRCLETCPDVEAIIRKAVSSAEEGKFSELRLGSTRWSDSIGVTRDDTIESLERRVREIGEQLDRC